MFSIFITMIAIYTGCTDVLTQLFCERVGKCFFKLALYKVVYQLLNSFRYSYDIDHFNRYWLFFIFLFFMHFFVNKIFQPLNIFLIAVITKVSERVHFGIIGLNNVNVH